MVDRNAIDSFFADIQKALGAEAVNRAEETVIRYGENTMPGGDRRPLGVVYPGSTADVQAVVVNQHCGRSHWQQRRRSRRGNPGAVPAAGSARCGRWWWWKRR